MACTAHLKTESRFGKEEAMSNSVITLENINKHYGKHEVLKGVNLDIKKGQIYGLVGKNGAGKSTIFKVILGLSDYSEGNMHVGDEKDTLEQGRSKIGFLIGNNYFPYADAKHNLMYYAKLKGIKDKNEVDRVLKLVGLDGVKTKVKGFSLGMRQRLGIANAILGNPEVLILDEPTNGLDPQGIADIRKLVQKLNEEYGMTVIVSSHILGELQNTAHEFAILNNGKIMKVLTQEELTSDENAIQIKIDKADMEKALEVLKENGISVIDTVKASISLEDFYFALIGGEK